MTREKEFVFTGKEFTPSLNEFVNYLIHNSPSQEEQALMCILAIMDETYQDILDSPYINEDMQAAVKFMYKNIEEYLELEEGH